MMKKYEIGLYEKAMRNTLSWSEKLGCAKECGYDYMEMCIDATDEKINRIFMNTAEKKEIMEAVFQAGLPIGSMSVSALTKYALGDPDEEIRKKAMQIAEKSIELLPEPESFLRGFLGEKQHLHMSRGHIREGQTYITEGPLRGKEKMIRKIDRHKRLARLELPVADGIQTLYAGLEIFSKINLSAH